jgi:hypothetical protein
MTEDDTPDPDLASELRQSAGREWAEEAAEDERLTETLRRRRSELKDVMAGFANRGDRVSVEFGGHSFGGAVVAAGEDFVRIQGPGQVADIRVDKARWSVLVSGDPPDHTEEAVDTFIALLRQFESDGSTVRFALDGGDMVIGKVAVVAVDHVEISDVDDRLFYIPTGLILGAIRSIDFH